MKKILVTGGAGFIGSNLCEYLLQQGHQVTCMDNFYSSCIRNLEDLRINPHFKLIEHNIIQPLLLDETYDEIYHLACPASPKQYQKDPLYTLDTNYLGTKNILEFALPSKTKVLLTSTSEVYGNPLVHPQVETYWGNVNPTGIRSCYDEGKRIAETLMVDYHRKYNLPIKIARIFNTYGPKMGKDDGRVVSNFINQAINNLPITIYGDGSQTRSFCYVDDMVLGLVSLMESNQSITTPINIGNPNELSILDIALLIIKLTNSDSKLDFKPLPSDDPKLRQPDITKAADLLNWGPNIELQIGILKAIEYFRGVE
jgi:UDP-glucuronate decarboxylase